MTAGLNQGDTSQVQPKHFDHFKVFETFSSGRHYRLWMTGISEPAIVESTANQGAGIDKETARHYTFVECQMLMRDTSGEYVGKPGEEEKGYIIAYERPLGEMGSRGENFYFTRSLDQKPEKISLITEMNEARLSEGFARQVSAILGNISVRH